jgi:metal-responsive CopG/Arc/MetJ family transcriptional regulator
MKAGMIERMRPLRPGRSTRFTVSLPEDLFARGEKERAKRDISRSEFVATLYRHFLDELENRERVARYAAAYARQAETEEEHAWADASAQALADFHGDE